MRKCNDWLKEYVDYNSGQESPSMFHLWVGYSMVAAALDRNSFINRGYYKLYPNLYIVLVGASARVRKTTAVNIGHKIFKDALPNKTIISQKITPEALINMLGERYKKVKISSGYLISSELSVFLSASARDAGLIQLLTKLYDCEDILDYHTIVRGKEEVYNCCCNILGATTPDWLKGGMPEHSVGGGFTSRVIFVYQDRPDRLVAFPIITDEMREMRKKLVSDLGEIGKLRGEFKLSRDAMDWFEDWYVDVFKPEMYKEKALNGYYGRKHDTLLKLGMLRCACRGDRLIVEAEDLAKSLHSLNVNEKKLPQTIKLIEVTSEGRDTDKVLRVISRRDEVGYSELLRSLSYCMNSKKINEVIEGLLSSEVIKETIKNGKKYYKTL